MSTELNQVKDTIRKLLNLARNDAATEGEINNAIKFAQRLMAAHHLTEENIGDNEQKKVIGQGVVYASGARADAWEHGLAIFITKFIGSVGVYNSGKTVLRTAEGLIRRKPTGEEIVRIAFQFYGLEEEVKLAQDLYNNLSETITAMALLKHGSPYRLGGREYANGFIHGLNEQIKKNVQELSVESTSRALIVQADKVALAKLNNAQSWLANVQNVKLRKPTGRLRGTSATNAYSSGFNDGKNAEINTQRQKRIS